MLQAHTKKLLEQMRLEDKSFDGSGEFFEPGELKDRDEGSKLAAGKASRVRIKAASGGEFLLLACAVMSVRIKAASGDELWFLACFCCVIQ